MRNTRCRSRLRLGTSRIQRRVSELRSPQLPNGMQSLCEEGPNRRFAPTPIIISGDESVKDEIKGTPDGRVATHFAERIVFIANHLVP
jgi:hypothetical protein